MPLNRAFKGLAHPRNQAAADGFQNLWIDLGAVPRQVGFIHVAQGGHPAILLRQESLE